MKPKFFLITTIPRSLNFFKKQISEIHKTFDVSLISSPSEILEDIAKREGVESIGIEIKREISIINDLKSLFKLTSIFIKKKPFVIHCNTPKGSFVGLFAGFLARVPNRIYYIHGLRYEGAAGFKRKLLVGMEKMSCFFATKIIAVSFGVKETVQKELTSKKIDVIHNGSANGIITEDYVGKIYDITKVRKELDISQNDFVFGFVGRLVGDKGINELVEAFDKLNKINKNIKLILVGRYEENLDPLKKDTINIIKNNQNIIETGYQTDVKKYLYIMDVFVSPSYREGFGLSLLEANLMGKPVIATKITGYSEIVEENVNGYLISPKNVQELYFKMKDVYENKESLHKMRENCIEPVVVKYDHKVVLRKATSYYNNLVD